MTATTTDLAAEFAALHPDQQRAALALVAATTRCDPDQRSVASDHCLVTTAMFAAFPRSEADDKVLPLALMLTRLAELITIAARIEHGVYDQKEA
ncbi:hypothetical protein [Nocardioides sp. KR10-350]|uniref:hypothetical protein n=1 Tax=Nocardioides cheoyonin TaxID=3156615 RepID=UPI0032B4FF1C